MVRDVDALSSFTQLADVIEKLCLIHFGPASAGRALRGNKGLDDSARLGWIRLDSARLGSARLDSAHRQFQPNSSLWGAIYCGRRNRDPPSADPPTPATQLSKGFPGFKRLKLVRQ